MITVLLVEDHASYRQALETVLAIEADLQVVAQVDHAEAAGDAAAQFRPVLAVVDLDLAGGSGVDALIDIRRASPGTVCVVLSALTDDVEFGRSIEAGAAAVLHKSADIVDLLDVLRRVAAGETVLPPEETSRRLRALAATRERDWYAHLLAEKLTSREREVLACLTQGLDHRHIASQLVISPETVQTHIRNLMGKLAVSSRLEAVVKGLRLGLVAHPAEVVCTSARALPTQGRRPHSATPCMNVGA